MTKRNLWTLVIGLALIGVPFGLAVGLVAAFWWPFTASFLILVALIYLVPPGGSTPSGVRYFRWVTGKRRFEFDTPILFVGGLVLWSIGGVLGAMGIALVALTVGIVILRSVRDFGQRSAKRGDQRNGRSTAD